MGHGNLGLLVCAGCPGSNVCQGLARQDTREMGTRKAAEVQKEEVEVKEKGSIADIFHTETLTSAAIGCRGPGGCCRRLWK